MKDTMIDSSVWAVILAAGRGTRMKSTDVNKVALSLGGKPMIVRTIENLRTAGIHNIVVVVGFAKESVLQHLDSDIIVAEQTEQKGTGHAVSCALEKIPTASTVFVLNGDDSYVFNSGILTKLYQEHQDAGAEVSFLTLIAENPTGLGRVVREDGKVVGIIEEKDASGEQKQIKEINPACYLFSYSFLKENINRITESPVTGEYYITALIELAFEQHIAIATHTVEGLNWRGVNTPEELQEANRIVSNV